MLFPSFTDVIPRLSVRVIVLVASNVRWPYDSRYQVSIWCLIIRQELDHYSKSCIVTQGSGLSGRDGYGDIPGELEHRLIFPIPTGFYSLEEPVVVYVLLH